MQTEISVYGLADINCEIFPHLDFLAEILGKKGYQAASIFKFDGFKNEHASAIQVRGGFLVLKGSIAALIESSKLPLYIKRLRKQLIDDNVLVKNQEKTGYIFTKPYLFKNEIEATRVICGNTNEKNCPTCRIWQDSLGKQPLEYRINNDVIIQVEA